MAAPKKSKGFARPHGLTLQELYAQWPKGDEGHLAAGLMRRYFFSLLVDSSLGAECNAVTAQSEAGASKTIAKVVSDIAKLGDEPAEPPKPFKMQKLHRFSQPKTNENPPSTEKP